MGGWDAGCRMFPGLSGLHTVTGPGCGELEVMGRDTLGGVSSRTLQAWAKRPAEGPAEPPWVWLVRTAQERRLFLSPEFHVAGPCDQWDTSLLMCDLPWRALASEPGRAGFGSGFAGTSGKPSPL